VIVIHVALLVAVQLQPAAAATPTFAVPPLGSNEALDEDKE